MGEAMTRVYTNAFPSMVPPSDYDAPPPPQQTITVEAREFRGLYALFVAVHDLCKAERAKAKKATAEAEENVRSQYARMMEFYDGTIVRRPGNGRKRGMRK